MKKLSLFLAVLMAFCLAACQSDNLSNSNSEVKNGKTATITVSIPDVMSTRGADILTDANAAIFGPTSNSAMGGLTNLANVKSESGLSGKYDLRYKLAVYRATNIAGTDTTWQIVLPATEDNNTVRTLSTWTGGANVNQQTFELRLIPNSDYKVVCWADFVEHGSTADLHYDTQCLSELKKEGTPLITSKDYESAQLNDESRDAYYAQEDFSIEGTDNFTKSIVLRRPWAKIRFVTTDWQSLGYKENWPDTYKLTYKNCKRFTDLNPVTAESNGVELKDPMTVGGNTISLDNREYALNYDMHQKNRTVLVDYLMTDKTDETAIHMNFEALNGNSQFISKDITTDIPIKRNYLTTILGNLLTVGGSFKVSINENFKNEWVDAEPWWDPTKITPTKPEVRANGTYHIYTPGQFLWLAVDENNAKEAFARGVYLENDIDMNNFTETWKPINAYDNINNMFDGQGHVLRNFAIQQDPMAHAFGMPMNLGVFGRYKGSMKNVTFENITIRGLAGSETTGHTEMSENLALCVGPIAVFQGNMSGVHAKHVFIGTFGWRVGGLIGEVNAANVGLNNQTTYWSTKNNDWTNNTFSIDNCSATDVHLKGCPSGGLIGEILWGYKVSNCSTDYVHIQTDPEEESLPLNEQCIGRFIGATAAYIWLYGNKPASDDHTFFIDMNGNKFDYQEKGKDLQWGGLLPKEDITAEYHMFFGADNGIYPNYNNDDKPSSWSEQYIKYGE